MDRLELVAERRGAGGLAMGVERRLVLPGLEHDETRRAADLVRHLGAQVAVLLAARVAVLRQQLLAVLHRGAHDLHVGRHIDRTGRGRRRLRARGVAQRNRYQRHGEQKLQRETHVSPPLKNLGFHAW
jgi:hypothetical protein